MALEFFVIWVVSVVAGAMIGANKGQDVSGMVWPVVLGPLGVVIVLCLPNQVKLEVEAAQLKLKSEELRVQKEILRELQAQRIANQTPPPPPSLPPLPSPPDKLEEFIPDSLRQVRRSRR